MSTAKILTKLRLYKKDPQTFQSLSNEELADLVIVVLSQVNAIQSAIETKKLDLDNKFSRKTEESIALLDRQSKSLLTETTKQINALISQSDRVLNQTTGELEARVQQAIANIRNGENGIVTEEEIERAAEIALSMLELPDFDALVTAEITRNGEAIRNALELLSGEERYKVEIADVQGLEKALNDLAIIRAQNGGTIGKNQVYNFIRQAIADGTITSGGTTTFTGLTDTPASYSGQGGKLVAVKGAEDGVEFIAPPSGSGDVIGPASSTDDHIALFNGVTGKIIKDSGVTTAAFAAASHTHTASDITDFDTEVSNNTDVAANTTYRGVGHIPLSQKGAANGVAELDANGLVPAAQLPSFVDDIIEVANFATLPVTGETGKIYVTLDTNLTYRWSGTAYVEISASLALGETSSTAYRGDRGKTAYDHSQITSGNPHNTAIGDISGLQTALDGKQDKVVVVSGSLTASNDTYYHNVASATYTDPSPVEGKGFTVFVRNGTATVGGTGYSTSGTLIIRTFHSGSWANAVYFTGSTLVSDTAYGAGWNGVTAVAPSQNAVYDEMELRAPKASPTLTGTTTVTELDYTRADGVVSALGNLGATETIDWSTATHFTGTLDSNVNITHSNEVSGRKITLYLSYSGAQRTITWTDVDVWLDNATGAAPAAPAASGNVLIVTMQYIGTTCYASATGNYAAYS